MLLRWYDLPYILRFGAKGFGNLADRHLFWLYTIKIALKGSIGGIVKAECLKSDVNRFIPNHRLVPVPNCIRESQAIHKTSKNNGIPKVLFLSNLMPAKGPMQFLKAAKIVLGQFKDVRFIMAGAKWRDSFQNQLIAFIEKHNLKTFVELRGGIYGEDKDRLFSESHVFVFPTFDETFGLVNIEAMQAGLPVISSPEGAIPEIIQHGVTGFIVDPSRPDHIARQILFLLHHPEIREEMGRIGRLRYLQKFSFPAYVGHWERILALLSPQL